MTETVQTDRMPCIICFFYHRTVLRFLPRNKKSCFGIILIQYIQHFLRILRRAVIESAQDIQTWFTGYGLDVDGASITADKVKIPRKWDDSFSAFNGVVQQSGMDLARYKGKTVEKWTALIPAASRGDVSSYGVLLVYKKKAVGAYLLEKPSGTVTGLKDAQTAMALQEAEQVSGEDFSGDWGERHEDELTDGQAQQTSGEDFSGDWGERHDGELGAEGQAQQTSGEPDAAQEQPVQYTDLPLDAEGYPVE